MLVGESFFRSHIFYQVLRIWYNRTPRTVRDLRTMLKEAEARRFVEKGPHDHVLNGTKPAYHTSGTGRHFTQKITLILLESHCPMRDCLCTKAVLSLKYQVIFS